MTRQDIEKGFDEILKLFQETTDKLDRRIQEIGERLDKHIRETDEKLDKLFKDMPEKKMAEWEGETHVDLPWFADLDRENNAASLRHRFLLPNEVPPLPVRDTLTGVAQVLNDAVDSVPL